MFFRGFITVLLGSVILSGCATSYGKMGLLGGMKSEWIENDTLSIKAKGNGFTGGTQTVEMTTLWAAEKAREKGFKYFEFEEFSGKQVIGGNAPGSDVKTLAIMYNEPPSEKTRLYDVEKVISRLGPKYIDDMKEKSE